MSASQSLEEKLYVCSTYYTLVELFCAEARGHEIQIILTIIFYTDDMHTVRATNVTRREYVEPVLWYGSA